MEPLLFLGASFLEAMTDPTVSDEESEAYRHELAAYLETEEGGQLAFQIVAAFNRLDFDDLLTFPRHTILWYLDWVTRERPELTRQTEPRSISLIWSAFNEPIVRTRAIEALVDVEGRREVRPAESEITGIVRQALGQREGIGPERRGRQEREEEQFTLARQIVYTLLTEQSNFALSTLGVILEGLPIPFREAFRAEIQDLVPQLGESRSHQILGRIYGDRFDRE
jgi:hypothetical protein